MLIIVIFKMNRRIYRTLFWEIAGVIQAVDFAILLPLIARFPLKAGYFFLIIRAWFNSVFKCDWRSVALQTRHIERRSRLAYSSMFPKATETLLIDLVQKRYRVEAREEFEGCLIAARRVKQLEYQIYPDAFIQRCLNRNQGLVLLTPHFDSFLLGVVFLGLAGVKINVMTSSITHHSKVNSAVSRYFFRKYRGMERFMNGGLMLDRENGLRPFYKMLERGECLVVLADLPYLGKGTMTSATFLGLRREFAGGAVRMAQKTGSELGGYVCRFEGTGSYSVRGSHIFKSANSFSIDQVYEFLSDEIMRSPGCWEASDLLPDFSQVD